MHTFTVGVSDRQPLFGSVYSLRGKTTPSMRGACWATQPDPMEHALWSPGLLVGSPRVHDSMTTFSCLCSRDFPGKWGKWLLVCDWASR